MLLNAQVPPVDGVSLERRDIQLDAGYLFSFSWCTQLGP